jgi:hypothetical protein
MSRRQQPLPDRETGRSPASEAAARTANPKSKNRSTQSQRQCEIKWRRKAGTEERRQAEAYAIGPLNDESLGFGGLFAGMELSDFACGENGAHVDLDGVFDVTGIPTRPW